jgi:hypothetical protein
MPVENQRIELWQGNSHSIAIPISGAGVDLTGATARWSLFKGAYSGAERLLRKSNLPEEGGGIVVAQVGGVWTLQISLQPADTEDIPASAPPHWYHEAEVTEANGAVSTTTTGPAIVKPTRIRPTP